MQSHYSEQETEVYSKALLLDKEVNDIEYMLLYLIRCVLYLLGLTIALFALVWAVTFLYLYTVQAMKIKCYVF